ncbi:uncharacterized protein [Cherax quadricarinatus]
MGPMILRRSESPPWATSARGDTIMTPAMVGGLVMGISLTIATLFCTALCLALWCRRLRGAAGSPSPATFLVSKRKADPYATPDHPMAFVMPTITQSEAGSEPRTPTPTTLLTPTEHMKEFGRGTGSPTHFTSGIEGHMLHSLKRDGKTPPSAAGAVVTSTGAAPTISSPLSAAATGTSVATPGTAAAGVYSPPSASLRPRSASPRGFLHGTRGGAHTPPLSQPQGTRRLWAGSQSPQPRPTPPKTLFHSPSTTSPGHLPRALYLRRNATCLDELREALHHSFHSSDLPSTPTSPEPGDLTTPDSVDGWAPVWTPASSIGSGGGCGLGELRLQLRYCLRTRHLTLTILSANQLPLRLGPDPVDTYTKAVLLPEKRVRFTTPTVSATDNATFNAAFTYSARTSRLAHTTLRLSVCQVTECGRRVVVGYAAVVLAAIGVRTSLTHDLDTGLLTLHLQESAPDQQVGVGGQLEVGLSWERDTSDLTIKICKLTDLQLHHFTLQHAAQVYVKVTVYINNTILCWRRTTPRDLEGQVTEFDEDLGLHMPELDLDATHLVLSARLRTKPGCGRRVMGSCLVGCGGCVSEEGRHHWHDMLRAFPTLVVRSHPLAAHSHLHNVFPRDQDWSETFLTSSTAKQEAARDQRDATRPVHYYQDLESYLPLASHTSSYTTTDNSTPTSSSTECTSLTNLSTEHSTPTSPSAARITPTSPFLDTKSSDHSQPEEESIWITVMSSVEQQPRHQDQLLPPATQDPLLTQLQECRQDDLLLPQQQESGHEDPLLSPLQKSTQEDLLLPPSQECGHKDLPIPPLPQDSGLQDPLLQPSQVSGQKDPLLPPPSESEHEDPLMQDSHYQPEVLITKNNV